MFLKFFLTFSDGIRGYSIGGNKHQLSKATDAGYILPFRNQTTFSSVISRISSLMSKRIHLTTDNYTREILVNLPDESMFQLELLCIKEFCYCTYNLETKCIGFGNSMQEAHTASIDDVNAGNAGNTGLSFGNLFPQYMIKFYRDPEESDDNMSFTCPDGFYEQVLNELKPYIVFEKNFFFKNCTDIIDAEKYYLSKVIDNYYDQESMKNIQYEGSRLQAEAFKYTLKMFMEDDPDILQYKKYHELGFETLGDFCFKIMQLTDETF